jgi:hypothetical protein
MDKIKDFSEYKAKKSGEINPKELIKHLSTAIENGEVQDVVYVAKQPDGYFKVGWSTQVTTEVLGCLEVGKHIIIDDM